MYCILLFFIHWMGFTNSSINKMHFTCIYLIFLIHFFVSSTRYRGSEKLLLNCRQKKTPICDTNLVGTWPQQAKKALVLQKKKRKYVVFVMLSWDIRENDTESFTGTMLLFSLLQFLQLQLACFTDSLFWSRQFLIWVFREKTHGNCLKRIRMHIGGEGFQGSLKQSSFSCMSARELLKSDSAIICEIQLILASLYAEKRLLNYFSFIYECIFTFIEIVSEIGNVFNAKFIYLFT